MFCSILYANNVVEKIKINEKSNFAIKHSVYQSNICNQTLKEYESNP